MTSTWGKKEKNECKLVYKLDYEKMKEFLPCACFVHEKRVGPEQIDLCREELWRVEEK